MNTKLPSNAAVSEYCLALKKLFMKTTNPKLGLERMNELLQAIAFDRPSMKIIQIVGTNGKGSTVAFIEAILNRAGISTGLFTSPHLCTARERIRINGKLVSHDDFVQASRLVLTRSQTLSDEVSFFECMLAMALWLFEQKNVAVAILEAGVGGRLDATTAAHADVLGVNMIDFDHQQFLGTTIEAIASEKISAAFNGQRVFSVQQSQTAADVIARAQQEIGFDLTFVSGAETSLSLFGDHQKNNAGLAVSVVKALFPSVSSEEINAGLLSTQWPGRFEVIERAVPIVLDGAHNPSGVMALVASLRIHPLFANRPLVLIYGSLTGASMTDKIAMLLSADLEIAHAFLHAPRNPRAVAVAQLRSIFESCGMMRENISDFSSWSHVERMARERNAVIVVCGSLYTVGQIRSELLDIAMDEDMPNF